MKDKDKILKELQKIIEKDAVTPEVIAKLFKFSRIQSSLNEKLLAKETSKVMMRDALSKIINPFYLKPEEAEQLAKGEITLGATPEGYVVGLDLEQEVIVILGGMTGTGKSTMLASIIVQMDESKEHENPIAGLLE